MKYRFGYSTAISCILQRTSGKPIKILNHPLQKAADSAPESCLVLLNYITAPLQHALLLADILLNRISKAKLLTQWKTNVRFNSIWQHIKTKQSFNRSDLLYLTGVQQINQNKSLARDIYSNDQSMTIMLFVFMVETYGHKQQCSWRKWIHGHRQPPQRKSRAFMGPRWERSKEFGAALLTSKGCGKGSCKQS